jgi:hypothetical protein
MERLRKLSALAATEERGSAGAVVRAELAGDVRAECQKCGDGTVDTATAETRMIEGDAAAWKAVWTGVKCTGCGVSFTIEAESKGEPL